MQKTTLLTLGQYLAWARHPSHVNSQAIGSNAGGALRYLAAYVFRVAISDSRIVSLHDGRVTFAYRKGRSARLRRLTLDATEFIRRFLQHVLPEGFRKIRYYGFMAPGCRVPQEHIETMVRLAYAFEPPDIADAPPPPLPTLCCRRCGAPLHFSRRIAPHRLHLLSTA